MGADRNRTDGEASKLRAELKSAGLSDPAIDAAWPAWWSEDAAASPSARAELRFTMARMLGIEPRSLLGERVEFVWKGNARFKHLATQTEAHLSVLTSFCVAVGRLLLRAAGQQADLTGVSARQLRAVVRQGGHVDLGHILSLCWAGGIPVIHLRVFPLVTKAMHAIVVKVDGRHAILLGRDSDYPAPIAFTLAHELGHVQLGHIEGTSILADAEDSADAGDNDEEELAADRFALELLTGDPAPDIRTNISEFSAPQLADAVLRVGAQRGIEPGALALCVAYQTNRWPQAMAALRMIYRDRKPVWREVNGVADTQLDWDALGDSDADYLRALMAGEGS